jgi:hypothetical protein
MEYCGTTSQRIWRLSVGCKCNAPKSADALDADLSDATAMFGAVYDYYEVQTLVSMGTIC